MGARPGPDPKEQTSALAPGPSATVAMFAANATDICHVPPVAADREPTFARNFALLFRTHGRKAPAALLCPSGSRLRASTPTRLATLGRAPRLRAATSAAPLGASAAGLIFLFVLHVRSPTARLGASTRCALAIWFLGLHSRALPRLCNSERGLSLFRVPPTNPFVVPCL
jgi:hypothetical protein